jgi:transcriptional regulator with XRE-family HTH domain
MDDSRVGTSLRAVRLRRGWRQVDVAHRAGVSDSTVSNMEKGRIGSTSLDNLRAVARTLDIRLDLVVRWRGGELDRLLNARHASLANLVIELLRSHGWEVAPEVSFSIYGERGWIDILAWHAPTRTLLVVEVKTQLVDAHETLGVLDRKRRLAPQIARQRGWAAAHVATWLVLEESRTNRRRVERLAALMRAALPAGTRAMNSWLHNPAGAIAALTFLANSARAGGRCRAPAASPRSRVARRGNHA